MAETPRYGRLRLQKLTLSVLNVLMKLNFLVSGRISVVVHIFILQRRLITPFFVCRFCSYSDVLLRIPGLFCVGGVFRIFIERKLSNLSALLVLSPVHM